MKWNKAFLLIAFVYLMVTIVSGAYDNYDAAEYENNDNVADEQDGVGSMIGYDEEGAGFVTVSLYGLLIWQFISLYVSVAYIFMYSKWGHMTSYILLLFLCMDRSFGMCLCGGITMCYNRFSEPTKPTPTQW